MTDHKIWDPFIRLFHWSLVAGFAANALILDDESKVHEWVGYAVVALVGLRLLWGQFFSQPNRRHGTDWRYRHASPPGPSGP